MAELDIYIHPEGTTHPETYVKINGVRNDFIQGLVFASSVDDLVSEVQLTVAVNGFKYLGEANVVPYVDGVDAKLLGEFIKQLYERAGRCNLDVNEVLRSELRMESLIHAPDYAFGSERPTEEQLEASRQIAEEALVQKFSFTAEDAAKAVSRDDG